MFHGDSGDARKRGLRVFALMATPKAMVALHVVMDKSRRLRRRSLRVRHEAAEMPAADHLPQRTRSAGS